MRHWIGIGLALGLTAAVFFAASWGYLRLLRVPVAGAAVSTLPAQGGELLHDPGVLYPAAALAGTALLAAVLIAVRSISPLAAGLPGLGLIAWTVGYGFSVRWAVHYIPLRTEAYGAGFEAMMMNGVLAAAGLALVVPLFLPSRWRSLPRRRFGRAQGAAPVQGQPADLSLFADDWTATAPYPRTD